MKIEIFDNSSGRTDEESETKEEKVGQNGNIKYEYEKLDRPELSSSKKIIDTLAPYLDHKVIIKFREFVFHNPGMHASLDPKFKTSDDQDSISINVNFWDKTKIPEYLLHELGHAFKWQIQKIAQENNLEIFPLGNDAESEYFNEYSYEEFQADLVTGFIINPEYIKSHLNNSYAESTYKALELMFKGNNFDVLRHHIQEEKARYKRIVEEDYQLKGGQEPVWLKKDYEDIPIYKRAVDQGINKRYQEYFEELERIANFSKQ